MRVTGFVCSGGRTHGIDLNRRSTLKLIRYVTTATILLTAPQAHAAAPLAHAFRPVVHLVQDAAQPVALIAMTLAFLSITAGNHKLGVERLKWASIGYIGVQFAPWILDQLSAVSLGLGGS